MVQVSDMTCRTIGFVLVMSYNKICDFNISVVRIKGNIILVGVPIAISYDCRRFGARACVFEPCKGCVLACFGAH